MTSRTAGAALAEIRSRERLEMADEEYLTPTQVDNELQVSPRIPHSASIWSPRMSVERARAARTRREALAERDQGARAASA